MKYAADRYVDISREEFENWLDSLRWPWYKVRSTSGIYDVQFSENVACRISTSLTAAGTVKSVGKASTKMRLVSRLNGRTINRKSAQSKYFQRTKNWRNTWKEKGVDHWHQIYIKSKSFYDSISRVEDPEKYKGEKLNLIESHEGWETNSFLSSLHKQVSDGKILSPKQEKALFKSDTRDDQAKNVSPPESDLSPEQQKFLERLRILQNRASDAGDSWAVGFAGSLISKIERFRSRAQFTPRQKEVLRSNLKKYKAASRTI